MRPQIVKILVLLTVFSYSLESFAQLSTAPPEPGQRRPPQAPIDEYLWVLAIVGLFIGAYYIYKNNKATDKAGSTS